MRRVVYIISGPAGVGKSTTSKTLANRLKHSAYISGDYISHMHVKGRKQPWESPEETTLIWTNILSLTKNFLKFGNDVVIDYVAFPSEVNWLKEKLEELDVILNYIVLWTDKDTLISRDNLRKPEYRMGERCLILMEEFKKSGLDEKSFLDTSELTVSDIDQIVDRIIRSNEYKI